MKLALYELRRYRGLLPRISLVFVMLVPLFYGAIYLTANWDPMGRLNHLPVAIVNEDQPTSYQGRQIQAGKDFTDQVLQKNQFQWHLTTQQDADQGLKSGRYYLEVIVPSDFSSKLVSGAGNNPQRAQIILNRNDANGFVIGSVVGRAEQTIKESVNSSADEVYFKAVFGNLAEIRKGMVSARDGAASLQSGLKDAKDGSAKLVTGATSASTGATSLSTGATKLSTGLTTLGTGAGTLNTGLGTLSTGSQTLAVGAGQVAAGTQELSDTLGPALDAVSTQLGLVRQNSSALNSSVQTINKNLNGANSTASSNLSTLSTALTQLGSQAPGITATKPYQDALAALNRAQSNLAAAQTAADTVATQSNAINAALQQNAVGTQVSGAKTKLTALNTGAHQVASGANTLHGGIVSAAQGAGQLQVGIATAQGGANQLASGASTLATGLGTLKTGLTTLNQGQGKLYDGATALQKGLADGVNRLPTLSSDQQDRSAQVLSSPADVNATVQNSAKYYGRGLAPLFFSIALWVFGISGFLVMRPVSGRLLASRLNPLRLMLSAWLPFGMIATAGALLMLGVVWTTLPLHPVHPWGIIALTVMTAVSFSLVAHVLRMGIGLPGSALLLVWLILQLSSTGGTYPAEVLPRFFQWIHPFMPITYSVEGFRVVISGGLWSHFAKDIGVLAGIAIAAIVLDVLAVRARQRFSIDDLHPPLEV